MLLFHRVMREPVGKMHIAAAETANKWAGFMDGAVQSGERAAREVRDPGRSLVHH